MALTLGTADGTADIRPASGAADTASGPLYLAGLVITLCGILAANAALSSPDYGWMFSTLLLTGLGFLFSFGSRRLGMNARTVDAGFVVVALLVALAITSGQVSAEQFLPGGADKSDTRLLATLAWGATLWSWALRSDNRVMGTTVPAMAALGLAASVDLNDPVLACFGIFILTVIFLLIHQNYLQNRARALPGVDGPVSRRLLGAQFAQAGLCGVAVLLAGLVVIVPAQALFAKLSLAQAIRQLVNIAHAGPAAAAGGSVLRFSDEENLQIGTGDAWSASTEVVMRVTPSDGQEHYYRGRTYDVYAGDGWESGLKDQTTSLSETDSGYAVPVGLTPGDAGTAEGGPLTATFKVIGETSQFYYAGSPRQVQMEGASAERVPRACRDGRLDIADGRPVRFTYSVAAEAVPDSTQPAAQETLRAAGTGYPAEVKHRYLSLGGDITRPKDIAFYKQALALALAGLPADRRDPLDKALAIRDWVSRRCVYSLAVPPIDPQTDHVHAFLGTTRRGYCDMFASSVAVLCRTAGIPARLATGFAPGDPNGGSFDLRGMDKHAWAEVYFPRSGWVAFDATTGSTSDGTVPSPQTGKHGGWFSWLTKLHQSLGSGWEFVYPLAFLILLILGYVAKTEFYDRWRARRAQGRLPDARLATQRTALGRMYARMTRALARLGLPRRPSETPGEFAARALPLLAAQGSDLGLSLPPATELAALSAAFARACYGGPDAEGADPAAWEPSVSQLEAAARRAFWARLFRRSQLPRPVMLERA